MMVPGMNFFREPERTLAVVNHPLLLLLRALPLPTSHGGQTSRPTVQNGGTARNGLKEIDLTSIKNGMLITMACGTIGNIMYGI
jgi:hypothetical protein